MIILKILVLYTDESHGKYFESDKKFNMGPTSPTYNMIIY